MNFSEAMFYENYLTSDFHTNTVISRCVCLPSKDGFPDEVYSLSIDVCSLSIDVH